jgi:hypothetical protein
MAEGDAWSLLLYVLSVAAATAAVFLFLPWALERRRRPEAQFQWRYSSDGDPANLDSWPADYVPEIQPDQSVLVEAAIKNVGDRAGQSLLVNFVVPDCYDLRKYGEPEITARVSANGTAGLPPHHRVRFMAPGDQSWTPGNWLMYHYLLKYSTLGGGDGSILTRMLFEVSESRFNGSGRRLLPSVSRSLTQELEYAPAGTPWPPVTRSRGCRRAIEQVRWIRAEPHGRVACWRGQRSDVRDIRVIPCDRAAGVTG